MANDSFPLDEREDSEATLLSLDRTARAARAFARCSRARIEARDEAELLEAVCRVMVECGYVQAYVAYARDDVEQSLDVMAEAGFEPGYLERQRLTWAQRNTSIPGSAIREAKPFVARDLLADHRLAHLHVRACQKGFQSILSLPLDLADRAIGALTLHAREADAFDGEELALLDALGRDIAHGVATLRREIETRALEQKLRLLAHYDTLTRLPNRVAFADRLREALADARINDWITAVMFLDLDHFKEVNDTLGHAEGDRLLQQAADRLVAAVRRGDTVGRLSGDEFAIVLTNLARGEDAELVARKIISTLSAPFELAGREVRVSASIGIALWPSDAHDQDALMRQADAAMYAAKKAGRNGYRFHAGAARD